MEVNIKFYKIIIVIVTEIIISCLKFSVKYYWENFLKLELSNFRKLQLILFKWKKVTKKKKYFLITYFSIQKLYEERMNSS